MILLTGCGTLFPADTATTTPSPTLTATVTLTSTVTHTPTFTPTMTPTLTYTPTITLTPTDTLTPTITDTPTITPTPTYDFPDLIAKSLAFCRYGPGSAYLFSAQLDEGDHAVAHNRNWNGAWLWVQPDTVDRHCWASASVFEILDGDIMALLVYDSPLPYSVLYGPPAEVYAKREGNTVTINWTAVWMTEDDDRGYMIEAQVCQNGLVFPLAQHSDGTKMSFYDETTCSTPSSGLLYTVEKHGYTDPVTIPWP